MHGVSRIDVYEDIALINFKRIPATTTLLSDIFGCFAQAQINIDMISQTSPVGENVSISFTCRQEDMVKVLGISNELRGKYPKMQPLVSSENCKITLNGEQMREAPGVFAKAIAALTSTPVEIQQITTSENQISLLVSSSHLEEAAKALGQCFGVEA